MTPSPGQIWKEKDARYERYVRILSVDHHAENGKTSVKVGAVAMNGDRWIDLRAHALAWINVQRFIDGDFVPLTEGQ